MPQPIKSKYTDESDKLILEDELQRILLIGTLDIQKSVTGKSKSELSLHLNFVHLLARKPNVKIFSIYSRKFFYIFHLSESRFTCPWLRESGLV
jgi:hypothetical protein